MKTSTQLVKNWENGRSEPKEPRLSAYRRLLDRWAAKYPAHGAPAVLLSAAPIAAPQPEVPTTFTGPAAPEAVETENAAMPAGADDPAVAERSAAGRPAVSRRPAPEKTAGPALDSRSPHGPLAVLDGVGSAYRVDWIVLHCPEGVRPRWWAGAAAATGAGGPCAG
ncbi:hypothetical protein ACWGA9_28530 [Streptomyces sp. NPDC054950]